MAGVQTAYFISRVAARKSPRRPGEYICVSEVSVLLLTHQGSSNLVMLPMFDDVREAEAERPIRTTKPGMHAPKCLVKNTKKRERVP